MLNKYLKITIPFKSTSDIYKYSGDMIYVFDTSNQKIIFEMSQLHQEQELIIAQNWTDDSVLPTGYSFLSDRINLFGFGNFKQDHTKKKKRTKINTFNAKKYIDKINEILLNKSDTALGVVGFCTGSNPSGAIKNSFATSIVSSGNKENRNYFPGLRFASILSLISSRRKQKNLKHNLNNIESIELIEFIESFGKNIKVHDKYIYKKFGKDMLFRELFYLYNDDIIKIPKDILSNYMETIVPTSIIIDEEKIINDIIDAAFWDIQRAGELARRKHRLRALNITKQTHDLIYKKNLLSTTDCAHIYEINEFKNDYFNSQKDNIEIVKKIINPHNAVFMEKNSHYAWDQRKIKLNPKGIVESIAQEYKNYNNIKFDISILSKETIIFLEERYQKN